jgi:hypothetical protein
MCQDKYIELQLSKNCHTEDSHSQYKLKKLKYKQLLAVRDAVYIALQLSATQLQSNMDVRDSPEMQIPFDHLRRWSEFAILFPRPDGRYQRAHLHYVKEFKECRFEIQVSMCYNYVGFQQFSKDELGIVANVCKPHAIGDVLRFCSVCTGSRCRAGLLPYFLPFSPFLRRKVVNWPDNLGARSKKFNLRRNVVNNLSHFFAAFQTSDALETPIVIKM